MFNQILGKIKENEQGAALIWTLILLVVVTTLAFSVIFVARQDSLETRIQEERLKAYYLSLSGIEIGYAALMTETTPPNKYIDAFNNLSKPNVSYEEVIKEGTVTIGKVKVTVGNVTIDGQRWVQIKSVGTLNGTTTSVTSTMRIDPNNHENVIREEFGH